jgi:hypothetical protein
MSIETALAELTAAVVANTAILEKLEAGREAALAQLEAKGETKTTRTRKPKASDDSAGDAAGNASGAEGASTGSQAGGATAAVKSTAPTADEALVRQVATDYIKGAGDNAEERKARAGNIKRITDHFGTAALAGDNGIKDAEQRAQAVFYLKRYDAGLEVNFSAEYDFTGDPTQGAAEAEDSFDGIG